MTEVRNVKNFEVEVYSDENGRLRYNGKVTHIDTREPVTFYYKTKKDNSYNKIERGMIYESLKNILYTCDYTIQGNTVYITR